MDIERAFRLAAQLPPAKVDTAADVRAGIQAFNGIGGYDTLLLALKRASEAPIKAVDIETSCLRPYAANARILTCAISHDNVNFSFAIDHPKSGWSLDQRASILARLSTLLWDDTIKIAHNAPFEIEWFIKYFGLDVAQHDIWECTQMQAHMIDERRNGQGLDDLVRQYYGIAYKSTFKFDIKNMASSDINECLIYNAADTKYTLRLWHQQNKLLKSLNLTKAYKDSLPRQTTVAVMQHFGIGVDQKEVKLIQSELKIDLDQINDEINSLKVIKAFKADNKGVFNPHSGPELLKVFKDYLKRPEVKVTDDAMLEFGKAANVKNRIRDGGMRDDRYSLDKNVLATIDHPLAQLVTELRNRTKLKSTYADGFELGKGSDVWPDGKIHTSFNTTFTETGRLSSDQPNQQNWPKRHDAWVRKLVIPPKGHVIIAADYGQLEGCTAAMCSLDKVLIKHLWENYDMHMEWTRKLVKRYPLWIASSESLDDKPTAKKYRGIVKNKLVFPAIYGASNESIARYLNVPIEVADDIMTEFWGTFTGLKRWQDNVMKDYYNTGYVASLSGRKHNYPLTRNQAINFPVQSVAADIVCESMNTLSRHAMDTGKWYLHPILNIHDDLTFVVPDDKQDETIGVLGEIMLTPPYSFINVPLSVEISVGKNWFDMKEVTKLWSNKELG
jgi:DNA polymerase-1